MDIPIKDNSGIETLRRLCTFDQKTKVVIVTGQINFEHQEKEEISALGVSGFYTKPLGLKEIEKIIF